MTKNAKNQNRTIIPLWSILPPSPPASVRKITALTKKLRKLQQETIKLADPKTRRTLLAWITSCLAELQEDMSEDHLSQVAEVFDTLQSVLATKKNMIGR